MMTIAEQNSSSVWKIENDCQKKSLYNVDFHTKILEVNLFAFAYRLFHEDFSSIDGTLHDATYG